MKVLAVVSALLLPLAAVAAPVPDPPELKAKSYVLMDYDSGQVLASKEPELRVGPASLTKLMAVYIAFDELKHGRVKLSDEVLVSEKAWRQGMDSKESRMFIEVGKRVSMENLLHGVIIQSGNDASIALAEHLGGTEETFAELMNRYAKNLGLADTHFTNATGVPDPEQYTTALDVALLSRALILHFPDRYPWFKERDFVFNKIRQANRNRLLWRDPSVDGIKTGHTESAGYHLAASAIRDGRRLISVVMGTDGENSRADASLALLNYGFRFYETVPVLTAGAAALTIRPWKGAARQLALGLEAPLAVSVPRGARERIELKPQVEEPVFAPVAKHQRLGTLIVTLDGKALRSEPLVALDQVPQGGLWRRFVDTVILWLKGLGVL